MTATATGARTEPDDASGADLAPFDALYRTSDDPWGTRTRWYERRKRDLLLAALARERYEHVYEAGCGTGHISVELAARATRLLASDGSARAVDVAAAALADHANAVVARHRLPEDWPAGAFDLVVLSEVLYFIDDAPRERVAAAARAAAGDYGEIVACDWRAAIAGRGRSGDDAHRHFAAALDLPRLYEYVDADFVLTAWGRDPRSVAMRDGLRS